tara:strand:+ start:207 stop:1271 length:1065 start_codon:yes stop_codon:yes gene_type:complete
MKKIIITCLYFLCLNIFSQTENLIVYDHIESGDWGGNWISSIPTTGNYPNVSVSPPNSTVLYGAGSNTPESDIYELPNISVNPLNQHYFWMELSAQNFTNFFGLMDAGLDTSDYVLIQLSTDGGINYFDEIKITGRENAIWDYNNGSFISKNSNGVLSTYSPSGGGDRTLLGDGYCAVELYIPQGVSDISLRIQVQANTLGEDWWLDNFELWEIEEISLPVELSSFTGNSYPNLNLIEWTTQSEYNSDYFSLEKSINGVNWEEITQISAAGTSNEEIGYSFNDYDLHSICYYRLIQYDIDGLYDMFGPIVVQRTIKERKIIKCFNLMGQEVDIVKSKGVIIIVYDDGTLIKTIK